MHIRYNINFKSKIGNINNLYLVIFYMPTYQHIHSPNTRLERNTPKYWQPYQWCNYMVHILFL